MEIEKLLQQHNRLLEEKVEEDYFFDLRLKARLKDAAAKPDAGVKRLWNPVFTYGISFILLVSFNFIWLGKVMGPSRIVPSQNPFAEFAKVSSANDMNQAYAEVLKWEK